MSRFYMYDSKTGAYAPVAEFANARPNSKGAKIREARRLERMAREGSQLPYNVPADSAMVPVPGGKMTKAATKGKTKRTLMQNLIGTTTKGKLARGAGALGALGLVGAGGVALNNRRKKAKEDKKSGLRKRYESLRSMLGR